jgi:hypothetical protein
MVSERWSRIEHLYHAARIARRREIGIPEDGLRRELSAEKSYGV